MCKEKTKKGTEAGGAEQSQVSIAEITVILECKAKVGCFP